jgi:hypothetical protein
MALGALSTLATRPACARAGELQVQSRARRPDLAAWLSALSLAGLGRPVDARPDWEREAASAGFEQRHEIGDRLIDDAWHPASWAAAAPLLREGVGPREWDVALRAVRAPLGRCLWRKLRSRATVEGPPGTLRGPYVVIRFESVFERRSRAAETITPVLGPDGRWRVAAYFIG